MLLSINFYIINIWNIRIIDKLQFVLIIYFSSYRNINLNTLLMKNIPAKIDKNNSKKEDLCDSDDNQSLMSDNKEGLNCLKGIKDNVFINNQENINFNVISTESSSNHRDNKEGMKERNDESYNNHDYYENNDNKSKIPKRKLKEDINAINEIKNNKDKSNSCYKRISIKDNLFNQHIKLIPKNINNHSNNDNDANDEINDINKKTATKDTEMKNKFIDILNKNNEIYLREDKKKIINEFLLDRTKKIIYVSGQPGTGKTSLITNILNERSSIDCNKINIDNQLTQLNENNENNELNESTKSSKISNNNINNSDDKIQDFIVTINCLSITSIYEVYHRIFLEIDHSKSTIIKLLENKNEMKSSIRIRKFDKLISDFKNELKHLNCENYKKYFIDLLNILKNRILLIILLDEVDGIYNEPSQSTTKNQLNFREFVKLPYLSDTLVKMIMICNNTEFDKKITDCILSTELKSITKVIFEPYNCNEVYEILVNILKKTNYYENIEDTALKFLAKKSISGSGDIRKGLNNIQSIFLKFFENNENKNKKINIPFILSYFKIKESMFFELMQNLTVEQKIVILALYLALKENKDKKEVFEIEVLNQYKYIKKVKFLSSEICIDDYFETIKSLVEFGLMDIKKTSKNKVNYKVKKTIEELEVIYSEDFIFNLMSQENKENKEK